MPTPSKRRSKGSFEDRARSVPYKRAYVASTLLCLSYFFFLFAACCSVFILVPKRTPGAALVFGTLVLLTLVFWFLSFLKRRDAKCPLCKGTPLLDSQAHKHQKAVRFFPLNFGMTNIIRIIFRQQFRCHFCGTPFDLLKQVTSQPRTTSDQGESLPPPELPPAVIPPIAGSILPEQPLDYQVHNPENAELHRGQEPEGHQ